MSAPLRDACSLSWHFLRTVHFTAMQPLQQCTPWVTRNFQVVHRPLSACETYSELTLLQILKFGRTHCSQVATSCTIAFKAQPLKSTRYGQAGSHLSCSYRKYATEKLIAKASMVESDEQEKLIVETFQVEPDVKEIKQALAEYLELTLRVQKTLALEISENSPVYLAGLVKRLKASQKEFSSDPHRSLNISVKELLAKSKFKGVEPYLESLGVNPEDISKVSMYARAGIQGILVKIDLLRTIGITPGEIPRVVSKFPRFLSHAIVTHKVKVQYLSELGMSSEEICKLITSYPNSLSFGLKDGSHPLIELLKKSGVRDAEIGKVLARCPQLLTLNVEKKLQPAIDTLESVGITGVQLARVLVTQPSLLRRRLERNIAFCREFGLDIKPGVIARLLITCPNFSVDGCKARVSYLLSIGLNNEQIVCMITKNPAFLSLNVQTALAPKVDYLVNVMGRPVEELIRSSTFLTMSLEHRIKPRHQILEALRKARVISRTYSLNTMVSWSDEDFFKKFVERSPMMVKDLWIDHTLGAVAEVSVHDNASPIASEDPMKA